MNGPRRLLFVDDEERVLEGLRDRLRRYVRRWSMQFVVGGPAARAVPHAHRILAKPCRREELEAALESACELGGVMADHALRETIGKICDLPPLPQNALRLDAALAEEGACAEHVASTVSSDIALSAQVLKHANSAAFANGRIVASVGDAVARLGTGSGCGDCRPPCSKRWRTITTATTPRPAPPRSSSLERRRSWER